MKPILYESTATSFTTNGIGILNDAISCIVTQQRNGIYEAEIKYPMFGGIHFSEIKMRSIILVLPDKMSDPQPMRVYNISKPMRGVVTINCRHIAYDLMGIVVAPFSATSIQSALVAMKNAAVTNCPFIFWTDKSSSGTMQVIKPTSIWSLLGGEEGSLLDIFGGGEYEFDGYTIKLYQNRGYNRGVEIRYGKNLTDLDQEQNCESVYTGVYPYWKDSEDTLVQLPEKVVNASGTYDYTRIYPLDLSAEFDEAPSASDLRARAQKYITDNNIGVPKVSIKVSFVSLDQAEEYKDLRLLEQVGLCDTVSVYFEKMNVTATAKVTEMRFNSILERYESVVLGEAKTNLADTIAAQGQAIKNTKSETETFLRASILAMTADILGAKGGAVRLLDTDGDDYPDTLYIADNEDPTLARKVWRFNYEGWGASSNGFNGPFTMGATLDGGIVADFITAGTMSANLIRGGTLALGGLNNSNGVLEVYNTSGTKIGKWDKDGISASGSFTLQMDGYQTNGKIITELGSFTVIDTTGAWNGVVSSQSVRGLQIYGSGNRYNEKIQIVPGTSSAVNGRTIPAIISSYSLPLLAGNNNNGNGQSSVVLHSTGTAGGINISANTSGNSPKSSFLIGPTNYVINYGTGSGSFQNLSITLGQSATTASLSFTGSKSRLVDTKDYGRRLLYCYETPSPYFGDIGEGATDDSGEALISIDDIFSETIRADFEYQVFLQKEGPGDLWITEKNQSYFIVMGTPNLKFAWEIKARQKDFEYDRLDDTDIRTMSNNDNDDLYNDPLLYLDSYQSYIEEQEEILYAETAQ